MASLGHEDPANFNNRSADNLKYVEDEYGYVDTKPTIAKALIDQLPSRQRDQFFDDDSTQQDGPSTQFRRRQSAYRSFKIQSATLGSRHFNSDVQKIYEVLKAEQDLTGEEKIKTLRKMNERLTVKRQVKEKLDAEARKRRTDQFLSSYKQCRLSMSMGWHKFRNACKYMCHSFYLWHGRITTIQGKFGAGVASYFTYLRWLLYLNLVSFFISLCFLVVPEIIYENLRLKDDAFPINQTAPKFTVTDFFTGSGYFENTFYYFGQYTNETISVVSGLRYHMPLAYLLVTGVNALINLIAVAYYLTVTYQKTYMDESGGMKNVFCSKVFCAWDYSIQAEDAAMLRKSAFTNEIRELLYRLAKKKKKLKIQDKFIISTMAFIVNIFSLIIIVAVGYFVYYMLYKKTFKLRTADMTLPLAVTLICTVFFFLVKYITKFEYYLSRNMQLYLTMTRVILLRAVMLAVIIYFWMIAFISPRDVNVCYETELGKEIYRLIISHFLVILLLFTGGYLRMVINRYLIKSIKPSQFDVAYNTLDLIYFQALGWVSAFWAPLSSLLIVIILILLFYIKSNSVLTNCKPPRRLWSVNESQTFFLAVTFIMFLLCSFTVGYCIFVLDPSKCGPFRAQEKPNDVISRLFFEKGEEYRASEFVKYLSSPGVMFAFFCALGVCVYFARAQAHAHISMNKKMREQLMMEAKDKVFLLKLFEEALNVQSPKNQDTSKESSGSAARKPMQDISMQDIVINQGYADYTEPVGNPAATNYNPGYIPANVPVNQLVYDDMHNMFPISSMSPMREDMSSSKSPVFPVMEGISPHQKRKGYPSHQPGFRYLQDQNNL